MPGVDVQSHVLLRSREPAASPVQRVGIGPGLASKVIDVAGAVGEGLRHAQVGYDGERPRHECSPETVPEHGLRRPGAHPRAAATAAATSSASASVNVRQSSRSVRRGDADDRRVAGAQRARQLLLDRAGEARQLGQRQRAAADPRDGLLDLAGDAFGQPLGPRPDRLSGLCGHAQDGNLRNARSGSR